MVEPVSARTHISPSLSCPSPRGQSFANLSSFFRTFGKRLHHIADLAQICGIGHLDEVGLVPCSCLSLGLRCPFSHLDLVSYLCEEFEVVLDRFAMVIVVVTLYGLEAAGL